jgi:hypothetical protein
MNKVQSGENDFVSIWIEDGILHCLYKRGVVMGLEAAIETVELRKKIVRGISYPALAYIKHIKVVSKEARKYFAEEGTVGMTKGALLTDSGFSKVLGNLFLLLDKPKMPVKMFTDKEEAIEWLKKG